MEHNNLKIISGIMKEGVIGSILTPEDVERILKEGKDKFSFGPLIDSEFLDNVSGFCKGVFRTYARSYSKTPGQLQEHYEDSLLEAEPTTVLKRLEQFNAEIVENYSLETKLARLDQDFEEPSIGSHHDLDALIVKKLLNKAGWKLQYVEDNHTREGHDTGYLIAPRGIKSLKTPENSKIKNIEYEGYERKYKVQSISSFFRLSKN